MEETIKVLEEFIKYYEVEVSTREVKDIVGAGFESARMVVDNEDITALQTLLQAYKEDERVIEKIKEEIRGHIGFENRLKREGIEPDLFNKGRFYVADKIRDILEIK